METKIFSAITSIMNDVEPIGKNKKNPQQGFMYRGIDDMYNELQPLFTKYKVFIASEVLESQREERTSKNGGLLLWTVLKVKFTFYAEDGSSVSSIMVGEAMDSADKSANKAMSVALKYCLMQLLLIPTEDLKKNDADAHVHEVLPKQNKTNGAPVNNATKQKNGLTEDELFQWQQEMNSCINIDELTVLYNKNKGVVNSEPQIFNMFKERKKQLA